MARNWQTNVTFIGIKLMTNPDAVLHMHFSQVIAILVYEKRTSTGSHLDQGTRVGGINSDEDSYDPINSFKCNNCLCIICVLFVYYLCIIVYFQFYK